MEFIDREDELAFLEGKWREPGPQLIIRWGKRRVGKRELVKQFQEDQLVRSCAKHPWKTAVTHKQTGMNAAGVGYAGRKGEAIAHEDRYQLLTQKVAYLFKRVPLSTLSMK
jgi:hypothetical protein